MEARALSIHRSRLARPVRFATAAVLLIAQGVLAQPTRAETTNAVTDWNEIAATTLIAFPPPASGAPPALQINLAMVQGAVYDAVNAIDSHHQPYLLETRFGPTASKQTAVATAAYRVLSSIV